MSRLPRYFGLRRKSVNVGGCRAGQSQQPPSAKRGASLPRKSQPYQFPASDEALAT
ncbi:MAG: hypothetical protein KGJ13_06660 [Patescibacteria group bacterium]|nr:hypothetical protein [Patescibacteria group bacterium]